VKLVYPQLLLCLTVIPGTLLLAAAPPAGPAGAEVGRLIEQLGSDEFDRRESATERLKMAGEPALDALHEALTSDNLEVRRRASRIVSAIENRLYPELRLTGHTAPVYRVCVSADSKRVLTSSEDSTLRLWDADTGKELRVFKGHTNRILGAALSPDSKRVLSGSGDETVRLWDATTGKELHKMASHAGEVYSVAFGPEGKAIFGCHDQSMHLWDLNTGRKAGVFTGHTGHVRGVDYSGKTRLAATCSVDLSIRLWNLETGKQVRKLTGHTGNGILSVCFSPDGKRLLSTGFDDGLRLWDVETGKELKRIKDTNAGSAAFSPDGKRIVSSSHFDKTVRVQDTETSKELRKYEGYTHGVNGVTFFPDGRRIASATYDGARIWRAPR
jgi:WD40 repeat protein